mmetsp:Transcript_7556/g.23582  ORF Transcript_7556/g.23582 Transcript_7556/m.23582 type:complete len:221 (+) Transcript_7556:138-800(+)
MRHPSKTAPAKATRLSSGLPPLGPDAMTCTLRASVRHRSTSPFRKSVSASSARAPRSAGFTLSRVVRLVSDAACSVQTKGAAATIVPSASPRAASENGCIAQKRYVVRRRSVRGAASPDLPRTTSAMMSHPRHSATEPFMLSSWSSSGIASSTPSALAKNLCAYTGCCFASRSLPCLTILARSIGCRVALSGFALAAEAAVLLSAAAAAAPAGARPFPST